MATLLDSFLVTLDSRADTGGFDLFNAASRRLVITLGDVMNIIGKLAGSISDVFSNAVKADVTNAKIEGLGENAKYVRQQVYEMSQSLGTDFASAIDNFAKLQQYGIKPLEGSLKSLKSIGMVYGSDMNRLILAYGQIAAMGTLQGQEKNQLINAGVPIWQMLTRTTGKGIGELQDMMKNKEITFDMVSKAFADEQKRLAPTIEKLSHSVSAQLTKMRNWWFQTQQALSQTTLWDRGAKFLERWVNNFIGYFTDQRVLTALNDFGNYIGKLIDDIGNLYNAVTDNFPAMLAITTYVLNSLLRTWGATMMAMGRAGLALLLNPITWIVAGLGLLLLALIDIDDAVNGKKSFINWGEGVKTAYKWFKDFTVGIADWLEKGLSWDLFKTQMKMIFDAIVKYFEDSMIQIQASINNIKPPAWVKSLMDLFGIGSDAGKNENGFAANSGVAPDVQKIVANYRNTGYGAGAPDPSSLTDTWSQLGGIPLDAYRYANGLLNSAMLPFVMRGQASQNATKAANGGAAVTNNNVTVTSTINTPADPNAVAGAVKTEVVNGVNKATGANANVEANNKGATKQ